MKAARRVSIGLTALGAAMAFFHFDSQFDTLPFPGAGLSVKLSADVKEEGEYHLLVAMPLTNDDLSVGLGSDVVPCSLVVRISQDEKPLISNEVSAISLGSEFGYSKVQFYTGGSWRLKPGNYGIDILCRSACKAAMTRGATISVVQEVIHPTEQFLWGSLRYFLGKVFFFGGIFGLIVCEFKGQPKH